MESKAILTVLYFLGSGFHFNKSSTIMNLKKAKFYIRRRRKKRITMFVNFTGFSSSLMRRSQLYQCALMTTWATGYPVSTAMDHYTLQ